MTLPFPCGLFGKCQEDTTANVLSKCNRTVYAGLSTSKLTASALIVLSSGVGTGIRGIIGRNSGKRYFEFSTGTAGAVAGNPIQYGVCTAAATLGSGPADAAYIENIGAVMRCVVANTGFGQAGAFCSLPTTSGIVGVAIDFGSSLIWLKSYNSSGNAVGQQWNVALNGDPAAGTGGITLAGLSSGTLYPFIGMRTSATGGAAGTMGTFNPTSSVVHTAPSGFTAGW